MRQIAFTLLLTLLALPLSAQEQTELSDTTFLFRFVPKRDMFYVSYKGNDAELERLCATLTRYIDRLRAGQMYISVSSYAASSDGQTSASRIGYLRNSRVKSELITRTEVTEQMFLTDRLIPQPYNDSLRNVVVVVFPAGVEKVKQIAGSEAAAKVEAYIAETIANSPEARQAAEAERRAALRAEQERKALQDQAQRQARQAEAQCKAAQAERQRLEQEEQARRWAEAQAPAKPHTLALRANLLRWATLTPDLGVEWRIHRHWGIAVDGSWTSWSWDDKNRHYALWNVSPAIHYYIGKEKRAYVGVMYHTGEFNYKFSETGRQGDYHGGGITGGYQLPIGKCLAIDFSLGLGYTRADCEKYTVTNGVRVRSGNEVKNYWGLNKAGVALIWNIR